MKFSLVLSTSASLAAVSPAFAREVYQVFYINGGDSPDGDATIFSNEPDQASGGDNMLVGCNVNAGADAAANPGVCARSLLLFDVTSMPADAVLSDVRLSMVPRSSGEAGDPDLVMDAHRVMSPWTRTIASTQDGDAIAGTVAAEGDVTWKYASYPSTEWLTAGGYVDGTVVSSVVSVAGDTGARFFLATDEFKALVTGWIDGTIPNYGFLVKQANEDTLTDTLTGVHQFFHEASGNKSNRSPKLLITYSSISNPDQAPSNPSGPGIRLPGEPTRAPTTGRPTTAYTCPMDKPDTLIHTIVSDRDATLFKDQDDISADKLTWAVGLTKSGILRGLLRFPLDGIPKGSTITCAEVVLSLTGPCTPCRHELDIDIYAMTSDWGSTGTNPWVEQTESGKMTEIELEGALANTGDSTWANSFYNGINPSEGTKWTTPGGDYDTTLISKELDVSRGPHKFPSGSEFIALVQDWVDGTKENYGFMVKSDESEEYQAKVAAENTYKDYDTAYRVFHGFDAEEQDDRPRLVVHYEEAVLNPSPPTSAPSPIIKPAGNGPFPQPPSVAMPPTFPTPPSEPSAPEVKSASARGGGQRTAAMIGGIAAAAALGAML